jgi:hypothetical protein
VYEVLAAAALDANDPDRVVEAVLRARERHPDLSDEEIADKLTARAALACAAVGAVAPVSLDLTYQTLSLHRLILSIARVSGKPATPLERASAVAGSLLVAAASEGARRVAVRATRRLPADRWPLLPAIGGALAAAAVQYGAARLLGYAARRFFFERRGRRLW